ncbi:MAG: histidine phosphatase family protein [Alphaproteobacteria bacterium]|nr:histidine phosphatase family protein [Alphaproteobacteria bacterium]
MHVLHLLRHAKAGSGEEVEDRERPLSRRGREAARRVGHDLQAAIGPLDLVLCSTARRTRETLELALAGWAPRPRMLIEDALYLAGPAALVRRLEAIAEEDHRVLLIGHNPGLHELALALAAPDAGHYAALLSGKFPTGARASFRIASPWSGIARDRHPLLDYATPKSLGGDEG